jgi:hypothetical protein
MLKVKAAINRIFFIIGFVYDANILKKKIID